ncbi:MAG: lipoyl(octanoyl) transferase [Verrucomicrobiota bacterium]|jgi:lipoate-protein ligase A
MSIFDTLAIYDDESSRSAAINMAIDEALLESANAPTIRFYRWDHAALSFGYFGKFADVANEPRDLVRRWTGGGIVLHGDDLTYGLMIPAGDSAFAGSPMSIYEKTHAAIQCAIGAAAELALQPSAKISDSCFANPVRADVMLDGKKIAGAAQRKTRRGLLQQGSIQYVDLAPDFAERFAHELAANVIDCKIDNHILERAHEIAAAKYGTDAWLRRR